MNAGVDVGYGMLLRLDVGVDAFLIHLVIDDNLVGIAIQRHALSKLIFGRNDDLFGTRELNRALGCTTVRVELAYGSLVRPSIDVDCFRSASGQADSRLEIVRAP